MEGMWQSGKWISGELYYYINFHNINVEKGSYKGLGLPFLRDIDWDMFNIFTEAIGFSGFELDDKYTCHRSVKQFEDGVITKEDLISDLCYSTNGQLRKDIYNSLFNSNDEPKKYVAARDYLVKIHPKNLGKPIYNNESKHLMLLGSRGFGKSYSASGLIAHNYLFDGCHDYDLYQRELATGKPLKSETGVGAIDAKYSGDLLNKVKTAIDNLPDAHIMQDGRFVKKYPSLLYREYEGSFAPSKRIKSLASGSEIHHRTLADNPLVFNGTRPNRIFLDEVGFINNLLEAWEGIEATQAAESFKRLSIIGMGTGGLTAGGAAMYAHEIFYSPEQYGCLVFEDIWENKGKIGKFVPATHALNKYKEGPNLITNETRALEAINKERETAKKSPTRTKLMGTIINKPIVPSEIFLRMEGTFFPVADFKNRLLEIEAVDSYMGRFYKWELDIIENKVKPKLSNKHPIREFPLPKGFSMDAPIEAFELPKTLADGSIPYGRYLAGWDVIDHDGNDDVTQSLQSLFILDSWTDRIVVDFTSRTYLVDEFYEQARRLLLLYNAICNYESNKKGPYAYFKNKNSLHLLCETPEILKDMQIIKSSGIGNKSLGTNTNEKVTNFGLNLLLTYYETQAYDKEPGIRNLDIVNSPGLIKETISYSRDINTDRVSAMIMLMILREDRMKITEISKSVQIKDRAQDPFWSKPFKNRHLKSIDFKNFQR